MSRLARLRMLRSIALTDGLRRLAGTEARCSRLADMQARLQDLRSGMPEVTTTFGRKSVAASRARLAEADVQLAGATAAARVARENAATEAAKLRVRVDVVDKAIEARR